MFEEDASLVAVIGRAGQVLLGAIVGLGMAVPIIAAQAAHAAPPSYCVALGDSLAYRVGASTGHGYVDEVYAVEQAGEEIFAVDVCQGLVGQVVTVSGTPVRQRPPSPSR